MLLRQIEYFQAVVEENSFTEAAERCHISQSAISQQIQALEAELGVELLQRQHRKFSLTPAGEVFYKRSLILTADLEQLKKDTIRVAKNEERILEIGYLTGFTGDEFDRAIAAFSNARPDVTVHVTAGTHELLFEALKNGEMDLVMNDQRRAFSEEYSNEILSETEIGLEVATYNPLSHLDVIDIRDLKNTPCILIASLSQQKTEEDYYRDIVGFQGDFLFAETLRDARMMVSSNRGVLPVLMSGEDRYPGPSVKRIRLLRKGEPIRQRLCAFRKKDLARPEVIQFEDELKKQFA